MAAHTAASSSSASATSSPPTSSPFLQDLADNHDLGDPVGCIVVVAEGLVRIRRPA